VRKHFVIRRRLVLIHTWGQRWC